MNLNSKNNTILLRTTENDNILRVLSNDIQLRAEGATVSVTAIGGTYIAEHDDPFPVNCYIMVSSQCLNEIKIKITESFDGVGAILKLGIVGDEEKYFAEIETDLSLLDMIFCKSFMQDGPITFRLEIDPGVGATQGEVKIQFITTKV